MSHYSGGLRGVDAFVSAAVLSILTVGPAVSYAQILEEITVTAQRREQSLLEVPISIEAFSGQELHEQGYRTMDDLAEFSPSIEIDVRTQDQNISIRGMGTAGSSLALEQAAPIFVDGVVVGRTSFIKGALMDVERIEVLRGPQPVFFGQNAVAGAFSIITRKPTAEWQGNVLAEVGNFGRWTLEGGIGGPITDTLGIRVAGKYDDFDGYLTDVVTGDKFPEREDRAARVWLRWTPTDAFTASLKLGRTDTEAGSEATVVCLGRFVDTPVSELPDRDGTPLDVDALVPGRTSFDSLLFEPPRCSSGNSPYTDLGLKSATAAYTPPPDVSVEDSRGTGMLNVRDLALRLGPEEFQGDFDLQDWYQATLDMTYLLDNGIEIASLTGFVDYYRSGVETSNDSPFFSSVRLRDEDLEQLSQEFRVASPVGGSIEWMLGAYWQENDLDLLMDNFQAEVRRPRRFNVAWQEAEWQSVFATLTYNFMDDRASIDLGGRYSNVEKTAFLNGFGARYVFAEEPAGGCDALPECEQVVTTDGQQGYTLEWRTREIPPNWVTPVEPIGVTPLDTNIRRNPGPLLDTISDTEFDPQVTLRYRPTEAISIYGKYATAFKAGGFDTAVASLADDLAGFSFGPEQGEIWELGVKGEFWEGRARFDTALFNMEVDELQLATIVTDVLDTGATNVAEATNAGEQRVRGIEFSIDALLTDNLRGRLVGAVMDGEMVDYEGAGCTPAEFDNADTGPCVSLAESQAIIEENNLVDENGDPLEPDTFAGTIDRSGSPAPRTPDWKFAVKLDYSRALADNFRGFANVNLSASDGFITNIEEFDLVQKAGRHTDMNLSLGIGDPDGRWQASIWARNLLEVQEEYNPEFDVRGDGILFDDAAPSWYTSYGVQFQYYYE